MSTLDSQRSVTLASSTASAESFGSMFAFRASVANRGQTNCEFTPVRRKPFPPAAKTGEYIAIRYEALMRRLAE